MESSQPFKQNNSILHANTNPQQLKENIEEIKGLLTKLQLFREHSFLAFGPLLKPRTSSEVPQDFVTSSQKAQLLLDEFKNACLRSSALLQEIERTLNPNSSMTIGIKRRGPFQEELTQKPFKAIKHSAHNSTLSLSKNMLNDLPQERLKFKTTRLELLKRNPPGEKIQGLNEVLQYYNDKYNQETVKAMCCISESNMSSHYKTIEFFIFSFFRVYILLKDSPDGSKRQIFKINFFSISEKNKDFSDSDNHVFRALTLSSNEQLPFPVNVPDTFSLKNSDPLPHLLEWIYSHNDLFSAPCAKCNKVLVYMPSSPAKFLPPIIRHYDKVNSTFIPFHTKCS